jgi:hypothetical protein
VRLGLAIATCWSTSSLTAQTAKAVPGTHVWGLQGLRAAYCVRFLVDPRSAARELRAGFLLVRADQDQGLHPALRQVIEAQPEFAGWIPSRLCFYYVDRVQVGKRRIAEKDARKAQMMAVWSLATLEQARRSQRDLVLDLYANNRPLIRAAQGARVQLEEVRSAVSDATDSIDDRYATRIGRTLLVWNGRPAGDSTRVEQPLRESWSLTGLRRQGVWAADLAFAPTWSRALVGSLRVEGKGDLAKALKASPIRFVGPFYRGGGGELRFSR